MQKRRGADAQCNPPCECTVAAPTGRQAAQAPRWARLKGFGAATHHAPQPGEGARIRRPGGRLWARFARIRPAAALTPT
jgi:hypothetical protein